MFETTQTRRQMLRTTTALLGVAVAGCSGSSGGGDGDSADGGSDSGSGGGGGTASATPTPSGDDSSGSSGGGSGSASVDEWLSDVSNYDGVADETGASEVTVSVGSEANGGAFGFSPAAVRVDAGTTVVWEWTGEGGSHNVAAEDGSFESELVAESGHTFSHTFEEAGTYRYACTPHRSLGMKGAVVVE